MKIYEQKNNMKTRTLENKKLKCEEEKFPETNQTLLETKLHVIKK